jgi:hypothetical protein
LVFPKLDAVSESILLVFLELKHFLEAPHGHVVAILNLLD